MLFYFYVKTNAPNLTERTLRLITAVIVTTVLFLFLDLSVILPIRKKIALLSSLLVLIEKEGTIITSSGPQTV